MKIGLRQSLLLYTKEAHYIILLILLLLTSVSLLLLITGVQKQISFSYNEGWNIYHALETVKGADLYKLDFTMLNYPPLSFYIIGIFLSVFTNKVIAIRYLTIAMLILISVIVGYIAKLAKCTIYEILLSGLTSLTLFMVFDLGLFGSTPQLLGHIASLLAFVIYIKISNTKRKIIFTSLLLSASLFMKNNLVIIPAVIATDLFLHSKKHSLALTGLTVLFLFGFTSILLLQSEGNFLYAIFTPRILIIEKLLWIGKSILLTQPFVLPALYFAFLMLKTSIYRKFGLYFILSFFTGVFFFMGEGISTNIFYDLYISTALVSGITIILVRTNRIPVFRRTSKFTFRRIIPFAVCGCIVAWALLSLIYTEFTNVRKIMSVSEIEKSASGDIAFIKPHKDSVICETILLCYLSGKSFIYDPFLTYELAKNGRLNESIVLDNIKNGYYSLIQTERPLVQQNESSLSKITEKRFTPQFIKSVNKHYHLVRESDQAYFYEPNKQ